jgi:hypothetical protein
LSEHLKFKSKMKTTEGTKPGKASAKQKKEQTTVSARDRIKPRGLWGWMEGKIHYDKEADIFNLGPL